MRDRLFETARFYAVYGLGGLVLEFTAKRGTAVRNISVVPEDAGQSEGRLEEQRIVILTEFVKRK